MCIRDSPVSGGHAQAHGQCGQERGGTSVGEEVSGLQSYVAPSPETADCADQPETAGRQNPRCTQGREGAQPGEGHYRAQPDPPRLDGLLSADRVQESGGRAGWLDQTQTALYPLATVETPLYSCHESDEAGIDGRTGVSLGLQPTRAVVEQWRKPHEPGIPEVLL